MICLKLNRFFYGLSRMLHLSEFVWTLRSSVFAVFNNFLLIDATARSKIGSDQKRLFIALSLFPPSFFANTPFKSKQFLKKLTCECQILTHGHFISCISLIVWSIWPTIRCIRPTIRCIWPIIG